MEISLIRHGKSRHTENGRITCSDFKKWIEKYDYTGVFEETTYPFWTVEKVTNARIVITSNLKRSVQSAMYINTEKGTISSPLFREIELPTCSKKLGLKLSPSMWSFILRLLWFCGYSNECESFTDAKSRAKKAAQLLVEYADEYKSVALVGHGFFNMLLAKELQKKGWTGKRRTGAKHWNCTTYIFLN
ncbi:phosphoglycerate mutase [Bacillus sp. FJAT-18017]|uniref:histidine phosphatase family protein n=1 Tax=Bacillus sp. FJAT-18017 TaxID=1705566 RepID=UPI0006AF3AFA|nr:histidine phosphatase family protein [Bacillus sp. FJAT-18017]ALC89163.1 phosphoglycerate mutase [Bacillus sp. FJAT-18017]